MAAAIVEREHARLPSDDFKKIVASESRLLHGGTALLSFAVDPATLWQTLRTNLTLQEVQYGLLPLPTLHLQGTGVKALLENDFDVLLPGGIALRGWLSTAQKPSLPEEFV